MTSVPERRESGAREFERSVRFRQAFERRHDDPRRDYGIGCVVATFVLRGADGAIAWELGTGWYLPHVTERLRRETQHEPSGIGNGWHRCSFEGRGYAVEIHSARPTEHGRGPEECGLTHTGTCWFDQGYTMGDSAFEALVSGGDGGLWKWLEGVYDEHIGQSDNDSGEGRGR